MEHNLVNILFVMKLFFEFKVSAPSGKPSPSSSTQSTTQEYVVRVSNNSSKKHSMIKFSTGTEVDFLKLTNVSKNL